MEPQKVGITIHPGVTHESLRLSEISDLFCHSGDQGAEKKPTFGDGKKLLSSGVGDSSEAIWDFLSALSTWQLHAPASVEASSRRFAVSNDDAEHHCQIKRNWYM